MKSKGTQEHSQEWLCHRSKKTQEGGASPSPTKNGLGFEIFQAFEDGAYYQGEGDGGVFEDFG